MQNQDPGQIRFQRVFRIVVVSVLLLSLGGFVAGTVHWRLVNDAAQIDYACFLMDHGMSPYRDLVEMNMPGIYLVNWGVMHTLGSGSAAWRCFDLIITGFAGLAMISMSLPYDWLAGIYAAALFALFHGRDGPGQAGQRDLIIAMLLLWAMAFVFQAIRRQRSWLFFLSGMCGGAATAIKPTALPFAALMLFAAWFRFRSMRRASVSPAVAWSLAGIAVPLLLVYAFLESRRSVAAFAAVVRTMLPFYARLGREMPGYLLANSLTPSLITILLLSVVIAAWQRRSLTWEQGMIAGGFAFGLFAYLAQGKGFDYHRYPMIAFLFLGASLFFVQGLKKRGLVRAAAYAGVIFGVVIAPLYAARANHRTWDEAYNASLQADLSSLGGQALSSSVLCLATEADCDTTLYRLNLVQTSGLFYDYFVFGNGSDPVIAETRRRILPALLQRPPKAIILGRGLFPNQHDAYEKLQTWPELDHYIAANYMLYDDREFAPAECGQRGYRIYLLKIAKPVASPILQDRRPAVPWTELKKHA